MALLLLFFRAKEHIQIEDSLVQTADNEMNIVAVFLFPLAFLL